MHRFLKLTTALGVLLLVSAMAAQATLNHRFSFSGDLTDSGAVGGADGAIVGSNETWTATELVLVGGPDNGTNAFVEFNPAAVAINTYEDATVECWAAGDSAANTGYVTLWAFGRVNNNDPGWGADYFSLQSQRGDNVTRAMISTQFDPDGTPNEDAPWAREDGANGTEYNDDLEHHYVAVVDGTNSISLYIDGVLQSTALLDYSPSNNLANVSTERFTIGQLYANDALWGGSLNELRVHDVPMSTLQVTINSRLGPDDITGNPGTETGRSLLGDDSCVVLGSKQYTYQISYSVVGDIPFTSDPDLVWSSSDTNIATIGSDGVAYFAATGTVTITGTYDGTARDLAVTVYEKDIVHRYDFNGAYDVWDYFETGFVEPDLVGTNDAEVFALRDGTGQVVMDNTIVEYIDFPNGMMSALGAITFECWLTYEESDGGYQRVWDFGTGADGELGVLDPNAASGTDYMYMGRQGGSTNIIGEYNGTAAETGWIWGGSVNLGTEMHFAMTYNAVEGLVEIYQNGVRTGFDDTNINTVLGNIDDVNNWIGRSNWPDANTHGSVNEFRIYDGVLTAAELAVNYSKGPDADPFQDPGTFVSLALTSPIDTLVVDAIDAQTVAIGQFTDASDVPINGFPGVVFTSSDTNVVTVNETGLATPVGPGFATVTCEYQGASDSVDFDVISIEKPAIIAHRWSFNEGDGTVVNDCVAGAHGAVIGTQYEWVDGQLNMTNSGTATDQSQAATNGVLSYVDLPNGVFSSLPSNAVTFEIWYTYNADGDPWQRTLDFGHSAVQGGGFLPEDVTAGGVGNTGIFHTVETGDRYVRFAQGINNPGWEGEVQWNSPAEAATNTIGQENHIVFTYDYDDGISRFYFNGEQTDVDTAPIPLSVVDDVNVWIGRAQYAVDPLLNGRVNELRIYNGLLTADEVVRNYAWGPDNAPLINGISAASGNAVVTWDEHPLDTGFGVDATADLAAGFSPSGVTPNMTGTDDLVNHMEATIPISGDVENYRLSLDPDCP